MTKWADQIEIPLYQYHDHRALLSPGSTLGTVPLLQRGVVSGIWPFDRISHITMQLEVLEWSIIAPSLHYAYLVVMGFPGELTCSMHDH